jgi:hypothetical protein
LSDRRRRKFGRRRDGHWRKGATRALSYEIQNVGAFYNRDSRRPNRNAGHRVRDSKVARKPRLTFDRSKEGGIACLLENLDSSVASRIRYIRVFESFRVLDRLDNRGDLSNRREDVLPRQDRKGQKPIILVYCLARRLNRQWKI